MSAINTVSAERFGPLIDRLTSVDWPVPESAVEQFLETTQWRLEEKVDDKSYVVDAGLGLNTRDPAWVWLTDGEVSSVSVKTSDDHAQETMPAEFRDGFAEQVEAITSRLGEPTQRRGGASPEVVWELPSQSWVIVSASWSGVNLTVTSPAEGRARAESSR